MVEELWRHGNEKVWWTMDESGIPHTLGSAPSHYDPNVVLTWRYHGVYHRLNGPAAIESSKTLPLWRIYGLDLRGRLLLW